MVNWINRYLQYKRALECAYWGPGWRSFKAHLRIEAMVVVGGALVAGFMAWPDVLKVIISGILGGTAVLILILTFEVGRFAFSAPFRLWNNQRSEIRQLEDRLTSLQPRVSFEIGNADEFLHGHSEYMFKVTNHGESSSNCLVRLLTVTEKGNQRTIELVLPTKRQREDLRNGEFNLRQGESKYVMLIGHFPDGWRFLFEKGLSDPIALDSMVIIEVAIFGCGPKATTRIIIELLDESTNLLRLSIDE